MTKLRLVPWANGDRQYFTDELGYQLYLRLEREVALGSSGFDFDWKLFLIMLLGV